MKYTEFLLGEYPNKGGTGCERRLARLWVKEFIADTIGRRGVSSLLILRRT